MHILKHKKLNQNEVLVKDKNKQYVKIGPPRQVLYSL